MQSFAVGFRAAWEKLLERLPQGASVDGAERLRVCCGALFGILITGLVTREVLDSSVGIPMLIAPMGASAVLLFAVPASPLAQPWAMLGGNTISATIGVVCAGWIADPVWGAAVALPAAIAAMFMLRCLHPPSGAIALTAVLGGPAIQALGYQFVLMPVAINSILLVLLALFFNNASGRRYPQVAMPVHTTTQEASGSLPLNRLGFSREDLDQALEQYNQVLDVSRSDLESLFNQVQLHAYRRRFGQIRCKDMMSEGVVAVEFGTSLEEAWRLVQTHHSRALPVINRARRVIGMVSYEDFIRHANPFQHASLKEKLRHLVQRSGYVQSNKPEVVGQIMTEHVHTAREDAPIVDLLPLFLEEKIQQIAVVDERARLTGMLTQSDVIASLCQECLYGIPQMA